MEKRYFCLIYLVLLAFGIRKKVAAASIMNVLLTWKDHMYFIFNSVETSKAMDKIDVFVPFFTLCIFLIIEVVGIYYFWEQEHAVIYKIRLGNILNVLCVKYFFAVLTALKYYLITVGESLLFGRGDNDYLNSYETVQILLQPLIFLLCIAMITLAICSIMNSKAGFAVMVVIIVMSAFQKNMLLLGNYGMYMRFSDYKQKLGLLVIIGILFLIFDAGLNLVRRKYLNG